MVEDVEPSMTASLLRPPVLRLLALLRDFVGVVDLADEGVLRKQLVTQFDALANAEPMQIAEGVAVAEQACRAALTRLNAQQLERQVEMAALVDLVREALAIVTGEPESFHDNIGTSIDRFEALVQISDMRQLKIQLMHEVRSLRHLVSDRQRDYRRTCAAFAQKVDALEQQLAETRQEATSDALTGVSNRRAYDRACREWLTSKRRSFVLCLIDIDHFKTINDTYGHTVGDTAICAVASALKSCTRSTTDVVARLGGDEFAILVELPAETMQRRIEKLATTLATVAIESPLAPSVKVTVSCGISETSAGDKPESLFERADAALYDAKKRGRNQVVVKMKPTLRELSGPRH